MTISHKLAVHRWAPFTYQMVFVGPDMRLADMTLQVRQYRDAPGDPVISLTKQPPGAKGLSVEYDPSFSFSPQQGADVIVAPASLINIFIDQATIEGIMPFPANGRPADDPDVTLVYDLVITEADGIKRRRVEGEFVIVAGVTR